MFFRGLGFSFASVILNNPLYFSVATFTALECEKLVSTHCCSICVDGEGQRFYSPSANVDANC